MLEQNFDPTEHTLTEMIDFMERQELAESLWESGTPIKEKKSTSPSDNAESGKASSGRKRKDPNGEASKPKAAASGNGKKAKPHCLLHGAVGFEASPLGSFLFLPLLALPESALSLGLVDFFP